MEFNENNENDSTQLSIANYFYSGISKLSSIDNNNTFLQGNNFSKAYICCYEINTKAYKPFLQFLLNKSALDVLSFPSVTISLFDKNEEDLLSYLEMYIYIIFNNVNITEKMVLNGYYVYENDVYFFYNVTNCQIDVNDIYRENNAWLCLVDEIVNKKHICNMKIEDDVADFFIVNNEFMVLKDLNDKWIESPTALYVGKEEKWINFTFMFGESKKDKNNILGPYYYFTNFTNAITQLKNQTQNMKQSKLGVIRFAIFLGDMKVIQNFSKDEIDDSLMKQDKLLDEENNNVSYESLLMRITDYDGNWSSNHDSCYLGKIELDNGTFIKNAPIWVIKEYEQQFPLSYHFIDKRHLGDNNEESNYCIV